MKQDRPWFPFYAADWTSNQKLRRCPHELKGVWIDVMCLMHESEEYGVLRWPLDEIARTIGCKRRQLEMIVEREVMKGAGAGQLCAPLLFIPKHGRRLGLEVVLIAIQQGPIWFSSRMVEDEYKRLAKQGLASQDPSPKPPNGEDDPYHQSPPLVNGKHSPNPSPLTRAGETEDRGQRTEEATATTVVTASADRPQLSLVAQPAGPPPCPHKAIVEAFHRLLPQCPRVKDWGPERQRLLFARWERRIDRQSLAWWERLFEFAAQSPFLMGHVDPAPGRRRFVLRLPWIVESEKNLLKVIEGNYHDEEQA